MKMYLQPAALPTRHALPKPIGAVPIVVGPVVVFPLVILALIRTVLNNFK